MAKYGLGADVLVKAKVVEIREREDGFYYTIKFNGQLGFIDTTIPEKEIVEDGE